MTRKDEVGRTLHAHALAGCAPRPLAAYLKALGVLRIIAEQIDPEARGYWKDEQFVLVTQLDRPAFLEFFLHTWCPSPFVSPWNKGSGLLSADAKGVGPLERSVAPRFEPLRDGIRDARALAAEMVKAVAAEKAIKNEANRLEGRAAKAALRANPEYRQRLSLAARRCKTLKDELQSECQRRWRGPSLRWLRAAVVIDSDGRAVFPSLLGKGGTDAKLDFTRNAMERLGDLFDLASSSGDPQAGAGAQLAAALFGEPTQGLVRGGIGQYAPAASGGANATSGALGDSLLNPWDLPLLLEGALLFTAGASRRLGCAGSERTTAPFSARSWSAGYASAAAEDESAAGEQWLPIWARPWTAGEVLALLAEGRCQLGARVSETTMDVARAIARLGVARGVTAFERYTYVKRNGDCHYAVPLGRWLVRAEPRASLLDDLEAGNWWNRLRRAARADKAPGNLSRLERRLGDAAMAALAHSGEAQRWQTVLLALAELEAQLVTSGAFTAKKGLAPIPRLSPAWIAAADDGRPELPLALSLAGAGAAHTADGWPADAARRHWLPLDRRGRFATSERALATDPRVVVTGRDAESDLLRLVSRRLIEGESSRTLPLFARPGTAARVSDVMAHFSGEVDLTRTLWLARGLAALDWGAFDSASHRPKRAPDDSAVDSAWAAIRMCHLPAPLDDGRVVPADPAIVRNLASGDAPRAFALALQRLRGVGITLPFRAVSMPNASARRIAASLAFPISVRAAGRLLRELQPPTPHT